MKKLYNKALLYQYYHSGKWALYLGSLIFAFSTYIISNNSIMNLKSRISSLSGDRLSSYGAINLILGLCVIFFVYILIMGTNKRNNLTFLTSGPYSKEDLKKNQIIFLLISLALLIVIFIYINLCMFFRERETLMLADGNFLMLFRETVKLFVCGLAFISYLVLMDCLFSNSGITIFLMVFTPIVFLIDISMILYITNAFNGYTIFNGDFGNIASKFLSYIKNYIFGANPTGIKIEMGIIMFILMLTGLAMSLMWYINKKLILNNINKFFCFSLVEKIFFWVFSFSIIIVVSAIIVSTFVPMYIYDIYFDPSRTFKGTLIATLLIGLNILLATIGERIIRNILKKFL